MSDSADFLHITLDNGKYTVIQAADGSLRALRYGQEWRDLTGDQLICALAHEVDKLRGEMCRLIGDDARPLRLSDIQ